MNSRKVNGEGRIKTQSPACLDEKSWLVANREGKRAEIVTILREMMMKTVIEMVGSSQENSNFKRTSSF